MRYLIRVATTVIMMSVGAAMVSYGQTDIDQNIANSEKPSGATPASIESEHPKLLDVLGRTKNILRVGFGLWAGADLGITTVMMNSSPQKPYVVNYVHANGQPYARLFTPNNYEGNPFARLLGIEKNSWAVLLLGSAGDVGTILCMEKCLARFAKKHPVAGTLLRIGVYSGGIALHAKGFKSWFNNAQANTLRKWPAGSLGPLP